LKLLCDANIGSRISNVLGNAGFDIVRSIHVLSQDASDESVLAFAPAESRILITCDSDFGRLVFKERRASPPAIIYVQIEPEDVADIVPRLIRVLAKTNLLGHMVVVGNSGDRFTLLPE
jgi:predicted nuclease of predicted toxin-antitoxin system